MATKKQNDGKKKRAKAKTKAEVVVPPPDEPVTKTKADYGISKTEFVTAWETSASTDECWEKLAALSEGRNHPVMGKAIMLARASEYRRGGYQLKKYPAGRKSTTGDVEKLNEYIRQLRAGQATGQTPSPPPAPVAAPPAVDEPALVAVIRRLLGAQSAPATPASDARPPTADEVADAIIRKLGITK
jgi:hypothetical protein